MPSEYQKLKQKVKELECPKCRGLGTWDDASEHDIWYNTFKCEECGGTGINPVDLSKDKK